MKESLLLIDESSICSDAFLNFHGCLVILMPILNESIWFLLGQVSHHPMIVACHCDGTGWKFWGDSNLKSKFWGRSIQLDPVGVLTVEFDDGEVFQWSKV